MDWKNAAVMNIMQAHLDEEISSLLLRLSNFPIFAGECALEAKFYADLGLPVPERKTPGISFVIKFISKEACGMLILYNIRDK